LGGVTGTVVVVVEPRPVTGGDVDVVVAGRVVDVVLAVVEVSEVVDVSGTVVDVVVLVVDDVVVVS
jgi:hypothetical protein